MSKLPCILLVDDDSTTNYLNQRLLDRLAVTDQVLVAQDGQQALNLVSRHCQSAEVACPTLILLDLNMPGMNGHEFLAAYRQLVPVPACVVVVLTSSLHPRDMQRAADTVVSSYLSKPLTSEKVQQLLHTHFSGH